MSTLLHRCLTKATTAEGDQMKRGLNWALSRRAILKVYDDHLECGSWTVHYADIDDAILYSVRSPFFVPAYILRVDAAGTTYHFGLDWGRFWKGELPFPVRREKGQLGYSAFSIVVRVLLAGYLLYLVWEWVNE